MKKICAILLLILSIFRAAGQDKAKQLDSLIGYYAKEDNYSGVVFIAEKGRVLFNKAYGYRNAQEKQPHTTGSIFQIGSLTKQFTAEVVLMLAKEKKLELTDKLSKYFPDFPNSEKINVTHLLSHTSGLYNYTEDSLFSEVLQFKKVSRETMLNLVRNKPIKFEPGSQFSYSNTNYVLLGYIIEKVTGKGYDEVVRNYIFKPLGMKKSGFDYMGLKDKDKSAGYDLLDETNSVPAPPTDYTASFAAGAMYSTAEDLYTWHKALQSYKLLPKDWQEKAYTPNQDRYGFGWLADTAFEKRVLLHSGGISGFTSYILRVQEEDLCIIMLENNGNPATDKNNMMIHTLSYFYSPRFEMPVAKEPVNVPTELLQQYTGSYAINDNFVLEVTLSGKTLYVQATGQPKLKIVPESNTMFFSKVVEARIEFVKGDDGKISKLILHQGGRDISAMRR
jgi:CubicO group peptidase (beta-lactamase class C family)